MHKSSAGRNGSHQNNERLEFLGDAILDAVVGDIVFHHFKKKQEGFLTNTRSKIVQRETLNKIALEVGLDKLFVSNGHVQNMHNSYVLGNAFEALVGAVYLDRGYGHCKRFMEKQVLRHLINIDKVAYKEVNFKSKLLEWCQKNKLKMEFTLLAEQMENGKTPTFLSQVTIEGVKCGQGKGYSKKESQQMAAKESLINLRKRKELEREVFDAKGKRTAMEEEPLALLPEVNEAKAEQSQSEQPKQGKEPRRRRRNAEDGTKYVAEKKDTQETGEDLKIDFSEVGKKQKSRDDIIAEAEQKAFA